MDLLVSIDSNNDTLVHSVQILSLPLQVFRLDEEFQENSFEIADVEAEIRIHVYPKNE
jgi:hypothetical protein